MARALDPEASFAVCLGAVLRRLRARRGLTQGGLGRLAGYDGSYIGAVERAAVRPSRALVERCDRVLEAGGGLVGLWHLSEQEWTERNAPHQDDTAPPGPLAWGDREPEGSGQSGWAARSSVACAPPTMLLPRWTPRPNSRRWPARSPTTSAVRARITRRWKRPDDHPGPPPKFHLGEIRHRAAPAVPTRAGLPHHRLTLRPLRRPYRGQTGFAALVVDARSGGAVGLRCADTVTWFLAVSGRTHRRGPRLGPGPEAAVWPAGGPHGS